VWSERIKASAKARWREGKREEENEPLMKTDKKIQRDRFLAGFIRCGQKGVISPNDRAIHNADE